jgi:hypothetical protein
MPTAMPTYMVSVLSSVASLPLSVHRRPHTRVLIQCLERHLRSTTGITLAVAAVAANMTVRPSRRHRHTRLLSCRSTTLTTHRLRINTHTINQRRQLTHTLTPTLNFTATFTPTHNRNPMHMHIHTGPHA